MKPAIVTTPAAEEWRPVKGYDGLYEVSNLGRVRSLDRQIDRVSRYGNPFCIIAPGRILKLRPNGKNNYLFVELHDRDRKNCFLVHRLVADAFVPNPDNLHEINHKDENKHNNMPSNLEWCNRKYNMQYGTGIKRRAIKQGKSIEQLTPDGSHISFFCSISEAARVTGFHKSLLASTCRGKFKTAYGYKWRYSENSQQ